MDFYDFFNGLKQQKIVVIGLGVSNRPLVRLLLEFGCSVIGCDRTERADLDQEILDLEKMGAVLSLGEHYLDDVTGDLVFRTPGMHPAHPALTQFHQAGVPVTSEMEVFFEVCPCHTIAITGSDGKTTTTTLVSEMLKAEGKRVWLGGNIGRPLLSFVPQMQKDDYAVVELSSFQLMDMKCSAQRSLITNLAPNHLDVHKDMDEYVSAKQNVYRFQKENDLLVVNGDNSITAPMKGNGITTCFSRLMIPENGVYLKDGVIFSAQNGNHNPVLNTEDILIPGIHNVENYMAAIALTEGLVSKESIYKVASQFGGVAHRIELIREKNGVKYYNDSIASSPSRTISGLRSFHQKVILIAGGYDKKIPYDVLGPEICTHVKRLILTGDTAGKIKDAVEKAEGSEKPPITIFAKFDDAVYEAAASAQPGDVVILSPASASFDQFKNFEVRGNHFRDLVMGL